MHAARASERLHCLTLAGQQLLSASPTERFARSHTFRGSRFPMHVHFRFRASLGALFIVAMAICTISLRISVATGAEPKGGDDLKNSTLVYVGTYTNSGKSKGIYVFRLQTQNLEVSQNITLAPLGLAAQTDSPSFLAIDQKRR